MGRQGPAGKGQGRGRRCAKSWFGGGVVARRGEVMVRWLEAAIGDWRGRACEAVAGDGGRREGEREVLFGQEGTCKEARLAAVISAEGERERRRPLATDAVLIPLASSAHSANCPVSPTPPPATLAGPTQPPAPLPLPTRARRSGFCSLQAVCPSRASLSPSLPPVISLLPFPARPPRPLNIPALSPSCPQSSPPFPPAHSTLHPALNPRSRPHPTRSTCPTGSPTQSLPSMAVRPSSPPPSAPPSSHSPSASSRLPQVHARARRSLLVSAPAPSHSSRRVLTLCTLSWEWVTSLDFEWAFLMGQKRFHYPAVSLLRAPSSPSSRPHTRCRSSTS